MFSKFQRELKNFAALAIGLQPLLSLFIICGVYGFRKTAFGTDNRCLIGIVDIKFGHIIILFFSFKTRTDNTGSKLAPIQVELIFARQCIFLPHNATMYQALIGVNR